MYRKYFFGDFNAGVLICVCMLLSVAAGSAYCGFRGENDCREMLAYLNNFLSGIGSVDKLGVFIENLKEYGVIFAVMFLSGFIKPGIAANIAVMSKRGFVMGFTASSFFRIYGACGLWAVFAMLPELIISVSGLIFFSICSAKMSLRPLENKKKFIIFFVFFALLFATIFCMSAFWNGFLTTIFMKFASSKIL